MGTCTNRSIDSGSVRYWWAIHYLYGEAGGWSVPEMRYNVHISIPCTVCLVCVVWSVERSRLE